MVITKDKVVSLTYELRIGSFEGEVLEKVNEQNPLIFLFGSGNLLPKFEEQIDGFKVKDKFEFDLTPDNAYGVINENAIVDVPVSAFEMNGEIDQSILKIGNTIPMRDNSGNRLNGVVKEIGNENVKMDFNHPLAGGHLFFKGEVTEVRDATEEELSQGHIHAECGCSSEGNCEDKSNDGCNSNGCGC